VTGDAAAEAAKRIKLAAVAIIGPSRVGVSIAAPGYGVSQRFAVGCVKGFAPKQLCVTGCARLRNWVLAPR
jgi:hypothetical protein